MWHQRGIQLEQSVYHLVCASLKDDYEGVRLTAVKLVWVFCQVYPEQSVTLHSLPSVDVVHDSLAAYGATDVCFDRLIGGLIDGQVVGWLVDL